MKKHAFTLAAAPFEKPRRDLWRQEKSMLRDRKCTLHTAACRNLLLMWWKIACTLSLNFRAQFCTCTMFREGMGSKMKKPFPKTELHAYPLWKEDHFVKIKNWSESMWKYISGIRPVAELCEKKNGETWANPNPNPPHPQPKKHTHYNTQKNGSVGHACKTRPSPKTNNTAPSTDKIHTTPKPPPSRNTEHAPIRTRGPYDVC